MNNAEQIARNKLVDYAKKFLKITTPSNERVSVTPEQVAAFAAQVREGCMQDVTRLILNLSKDDPPATGKAA